MRRALWISMGCAAAVAVATGGAWWARANPDSPQCPPTTTAAATRAPEPPGELVLTEQDGSRSAYHHTIRMRVGQPLAVLLDAGQAGGWTPLQRTGTALRVISSTGGYVYRCPASPLLAHLLAQAPGSSTLSGATDNGCFHTHPACGLAAQGWKVTIQVLP